MPETLRNKDPELIEDTISLVCDLFVRYGWHVLAIIIATVFVYNRYLSKRLDQMRQTSEDPDAMASRMEAMERARRKQQEIYDKNVEEMKRKENEKEIQKRKQLKELKESLIHDKDSNDLRKRRSKPLIDNSYNPLMGSTSGSTYRSSRACGPSGGG